ncbi:hypothetical protein JI58_09920 [Marinosulfonomonas sp. PRT-SC04]|nr:hypothetical protein JI58_09920 [Marinosulfonomonas sp. PRT-SC04]
MQGQFDVPLNEVGRAIKLLKDTTIACIVASWRSRINHSAEAVNVDGFSAVGQAAKRRAFLGDG